MYNVNKFWIGKKECDQYLNLDEAHFEWWNKSLILGRVDKAHEGIAGSSILLNNKEEALLSTFVNKAPDGPTVTYLPKDEKKFSVFNLGTEQNVFY